MCRWSGELGPKIKEGDRQAPEGFYNITPAQMNPNSQFYLSFNLGYPNAYDRAHGRTGAHLMVHGDCSSRGCYAMTDDQIAEIYALARESFFGGQRSFQVQAYPFRMTAANFAKHRNNPHIPFWRMLKEGNDHFELTGHEPVVEVCEKRYVFNPQAPQNFTPANNGIKIGTPWGGFRDQTQQAALKFNPTGKCPVYEVQSDVLMALKEKQQKDNAQIASLSNRVSAAPIKTGRDGGMHPTFLAKLKPQEIRETDGTIRYVVDENAKKKLGTYVNPPFETHPVDSEPTGTAVASAKGACAADQRPIERLHDGGGRIEARACAAGPRLGQIPVAAAVHCPDYGNRPKAGSAATTITTSRCLRRRRRRHPLPPRRRGHSPRPRLRRRSPPRKPEPEQTAQATPGADPRTPIRGEWFEPDERGDAGRSNRQLRSALGRGPLAAICRLI